MLTPRADRADEVPVPSSAENRLPLRPALALVAAAAVLLGLTAPPGADYATDAGPGIDALVHGDLGAFAAHQPLMGSFSLLLRAPFAALAQLSGGDQALAYRLGAIPCLLVAGLVGLWIARRMAGRGASMPAQAFVAGACVVNPMTLTALYYGHPEELLGGALCVAAVLAAGERRALTAGALLGLALATKQWAVLAIGPVLVAAPARRPRLLALAGGIAGALTVPLLLADASSFGTSYGKALDTGSFVLPSNVWWPLRSTGLGMVDRIAGHPVIDTVNTLPAWLDHLTHPLIVAIALPLSLPLLARRPEDAAVRALGLLALLLLARCVLDPWNNGYYHLPFLLAVAALDAARPGRRAPRLLIGALLGTCFMALPATGRLDPDLQNACYLAWTLPMLAVLARVTYRPQCSSAASTRSSSPTALGSLPSSSRIAPPGQ